VVPHEFTETNPLLSVVEDGIIVTHESISQDPRLLAPRNMRDNASNAFVRAVAHWAEVETGCSYTERLATDGECNVWEFIYSRAREGIVARSNRGRGVLGSWDLRIEFLDIEVRTDDDVRILFKIC
jgi:hypothetical protein